MDHTHGNKTRNAPRLSKNEICTYPGWAALTLAVPAPAPAPDPAPDPAPAPAPAVPPPSFSSGSWSLNALAASPSRPRAKPKSHSFSPPVQGGGTVKYKVCSERACHAANTPQQRPKPPQCSSHWHRRGPLPSLPFPSNPAQHILTSGLGVTPTSTGKAGGGGFSCTTYMLPTQGCWRA